MNGETISVLTWVSQAVNACVNLPAQTVLGLWSHRMADGEHSLLAAATLPFHNGPWCHVQTHGEPRRNIGLLGQPGPLLTGPCVPPPNCFVFLCHFPLAILLNVLYPCCLFLQCWALHTLKSTITRCPTQVTAAMQIQANFHEGHETKLFDLVKWFFLPRSKNLESCQGRFFLLYQHGHLLCYQRRGKKNPPSNSFFDLWDQQVITLDPWIPSPALPPCCNLWHAGCWLMMPRGPTWRTHNTFSSCCH